MAHRLVTLFTAIATGAAVAVVALPPLAIAAVSPRVAYSGFTIEGTLGSSLLGAGASEVFDGSVNTFPMVDTLTLDAPYPASWRIHVAGPTDGNLSVGTFPTASSNGPGMVGLDLSKVDRYCPYSVGSIVIHEVTTDNVAGAMTSFAATYSLRCEPTQPAVVGEVRYNSTVDYERFGTLVLGTTSAAHPLTVTATGAITFGQAAFEGPGAAHFVSTADTCSGQSLGAGQTCTVDVVAHVRAVAGQAAALRLPSASGDRIVGLTAVGRETATGAYTPRKPARLLDTRLKVGVSTTTPIGPGKYIDLQVTGRGGIPVSGAGSVVLNMTVVAPTSAGFLTVYPTGTTRPNASSVNFNAGWTGANLVTATLGTGGKVRIYNHRGATHVVADVMGYYHAPSSTSTSGYGGYAGVDPDRLVDTRSTTTWDGVPLGSHEYLWVGADFGAINSHVKAFAVNITVTQPTASGWLAAWDGRDEVNSDFPTTSTLNFTKGRTVPNMALVPTSPCGGDCDDPNTPKIGILNGSSGSAHVIVDLVGFFDDNTLSEMSRFTALPSPTRILNTSTNQGLTGAFAPGATRKLTAPASVAGYNTMALVTNTTANRPTRNTVITLWGGHLPQSPRPTVSNLNPYANQIVSNMTITDVGYSNDFWINNLSGTTNLVLDVAGSMEYYPSFVDPATVGAASKAASAPPAPAPGYRVEPVTPLAPRTR